MINERYLDWEGCYNIRDLGGLPTADGATTRRSAVIRSDIPGRLTEGSGSLAYKRPQRFRIPNDYRLTITFFTPKIYICRKPNPIMTAIKILASSSATKSLLRWPSL